MLLINSTEDRYNLVDSKNPSFKMGFLILSFALCGAYVTLATGIVLCTVPLYVFAQQKRCTTLMELHELEQQRDAYAGRIGKLAIQIALIFALPAGVALLLFKLLNIPIYYTLPVAFIASWVMVISLYRRVDRKVRALEEQIMELKKQEQSQSSDTDEH